MNREKQIEEMAKVYDNARLKARDTLGSMNEGEEMWYSKAFYNAGYRKASEVDPFPFCSISGCEAVRDGCHKTCPDGLVNKTKADTVKKMQERTLELIGNIFFTCSYGNGDGDVNITEVKNAIKQVAKELLEGMMDDS